MAAYLRQVDKDGEACVSLVMAKSRVVPTKSPTTPRLELAAALVSAKIGALLLEELDKENLTGRFWVDSKTVLGYIQNDIKRFTIHDLRCKSRQKDTKLQQSMKEDGERVVGLLKYRG